ncbi:glycosyltransferase family 4 protein [Thermodesulfobacteriota bacterium]
MSAKLILVHLLNDFSGSPRILLATIQAFTTKSSNYKLYIGSNGSGILSASGIAVERYWYKRYRLKLLTLFSYMGSQLFLFFKLLRDKSIDKEAVIYVNTLLPFGAALYGKITGRTVLYHIHEISLTPRILKKFLISIARKTSALNVYVSNAHLEAMAIPGVPAQRVYNALDQTFLDHASASIYEHCNNGKFKVLMIASLRDYKGVPELLTICNCLAEESEIHFDLVVNDDTHAIKNYFSSKSVPVNLTIHHTTDDTSKYYEEASLLLNLSRVDQWVETFGLTILEAMSFGIPVIVPPTGGPTELVDDGTNGYQIDSRNTEHVAETITDLAGNPELCQQLSAAAREKAKLFSPEQFEQNIITAIESCLTRKSSTTQSQ